VLPVQQLVKIVSELNLVQSHNLYSDVVSKHITMSNYFKKSTPRLTDRIKIVAATLSPKG